MLNIASTVSIESSGCHGSGVGAQDEVFEWRRGEAVEAGVHAVGVRFEDASIRRLGEIDRAMRHFAKAMHADLVIDVERARADQRRQFAGRLAALQIHLEESILRVKETERARDIFARRAGDRRHAERVAIDAHLRRQAADGGGAIELRQAGAHLRSRVEAAADRSGRRAR